VNDLVGRCIAESRYSKKTYAVTLTYANDAGVNAVTLVYKDVQDFLKRLRKRYDVRYIVAGEYGTAKGRAHWHIILFFKDKYPEIKENVRVDWKYWHKGFSYFQQPDWKGFQYVLKYVLKDTDLDSADSHLAMSKKPPLGHEFFMDLAETHVEQAVIPRSFKYKVGGVRKDNGTEKVFMMQGKTRENFMAAFKNGWIQKYGKEPFSEFFEEWDETNYKLEYTDEELVKRLHHKDVKYIQPWIDFNQTIDMGVLMEINYAGRDIVIHGKKNDNEIYEDGQWRSVDEINHYVEHGEIKRLELYEDVQRELLEKLQQQ
jgi:hypothetical protein